jgi:hypothetical protein
LGEKKGGGRREEGGGRREEGGVKRGRGVERMLVGWAMPTRRLQVLRQALDPDALRSDPEKFIHG